MIDERGLRGAAHPVLVERYLLLAADYARRFSPWMLGVTSVLRSDAQQAALYAQGKNPLDVVNAIRAKAGMGPITAADNVSVTKLDGVRKRSRHQGVLFQGRLVSRAVDVVPTMDPDGPGPMKAIVDYKDPGRFRPLEALAEKYGLVSGSEWKDWPHLELPKDVQ